MITGAHSIIYSTNPEADRFFFRDVLKLPHVDVGEGWLIFGLPPAELAVHPSERNDVQELYLLCDDIEMFVEQMRVQGINTSPVQERNWGRITELTLPSGSKLQIYEPHHARPKPTVLTSSKRKEAKGTRRKAGRTRSRTLKRR